MSKLSIGLTVALVVSVLANAGAGYVYLQQRDASVEARTDLRHQTGATEAATLAAHACSDSVEALSVSAAVMASQLEGERAAAAKRAGTHYARADKILATPAAVPGDDCASAQKRVADILANRTQKGGG
ncbi:hypothetical protein [Comamonas aquatica]|uniref:Uncharacterized protein n=1 Tax=Comamonas aquatica TaxID=225991 RepID=A0AA42KZ02_9BURK|nr:hypothetical protein [Comamonas aquatica]MDH0362777.1 hypothetical protein [Comamonas aquatica]